MIAWTTSPFIMLAPWPPSPSFSFFETKPLPFLLLLPCSVFKDRLFKNIPYFLTNYLMVFALFTLLTLLTAPLMAILVSFPALVYWCDAFHVPSMFLKDSLLGTCSSGGQMRSTWFHSWVTRVRVVLLSVSSSSSFPHLRSQSGRSRKVCFCRTSCRSSFLVCIQVREQLAPCLLPF